MPVVAIVGAVIAGAIAAPAVGAVIAGGLAALDVGGALAITAAAGATMSAIGVVTGDKGLTMAGAVLGGIGAVGSLASAAGLVDGSASLFGDGATSAGQTADAAASSVTDAALPAGAMSPNGVADITDSMSGATAGLPSDAGAAMPENIPGAVLTDAATPPPAVTPPGGPNDAPPLQDATLTDTGSGLMNNLSGQTQTAATPPSPVQVPQAAQTATLNNETGTWAPGAGGFPVSGVSSSPASYLGGILDFAKSNQLVSYGAIQAGGALVSGMFSPLTPANVSALDAQAANNRAAAALTARQTANIQSGVPTVTRTKAPPVTGTPAPLTGAGLINSFTPNNPNAAAVTGVPA